MLSEASIEYDAGFVEQTVWATVRLDAAHEHALHRELDPIYLLPDEDERDDRFRNAFADWFLRLKLDRFLVDILARFPRIVASVDRAIVQAARRRNREEVELLVRRHDATGDAEHTLVFQLCPESLVQTERAQAALLRELLHVEDMLDESFAYDPASFANLSGPENVIRDRYRVLWDVYVHARLARDGEASADGEAALRGAFSRAFTTDGKPPPADAFRVIEGSQSMNHARLLTLARNPAQLWQRCGDAEQPCGPS